MKNQEQLFIQPVIHDDPIENNDNSQLAHLINNNYSDDNDFPQINQLHKQQFAKITRIQGNKMLLYYRGNYKDIIDKQNNTFRIKKLDHEILKAFFSFADGIKRTKSVEQLILQGCDIHPFLAIEISYALQHNTSIKLLDLSNCNLHQFTLSFLFKNLYKNTTLQSLILFNNQSLKGIAIQNLIDYLIIPRTFRQSTLTELNINYCNISQDYLTQFLVTMKNNQQLKIVKIGMMKYEQVAIAALSIAISSYTGSKYLLLLDISNIELGNSGIHLLNSLINTNDLRIYNINISQNKINQDGCQNLYSLLNKLKKHLKTLNLSNNNLCNLDALPVGSQFEELIAVNIQLTQLQPPSNLLRLNLSKNQIKFQGAKILSEYLKTNPSLQHLNLNYNLLKSEEVNILFLALTQNTNLKSLHLAHNRADSESLVCLIANQDHIHIEELDLSHNIISIKVFEFFIKQDLRFNIKNIILKNLVNDEEDDESFERQNQSNKKLVKFSFQGSLLQILDFQGNQGWSSSVVSSIFKSQNVIKHLNLQECLPFTSKSLKQLGHFLKNSDYIQHLNIRGLQIGKLDKQIFQKFSQNLEKNHSLKVLNISKNLLSDYIKILLEHLQNHLHIEVLDISQNIILKQHQFCINKLLLHSKTLSELNISGNYVSLNCLQNFEKVLKSSLRSQSFLLSQQNGQQKAEYRSVRLKLKKLELKSMKLNFADLEILGEMISQDRNNIQIVDLSCNFSFQQSCYQTQRHMRKKEKVLTFRNDLVESPELKKILCRRSLVLINLHIQDCLFNPHDVMLIVKYIQGLQHLKVFELSFCPSFNKFLNETLIALKLQDSLTVLILNFISFSLFNIKNLSKLVTSLMYLEVLDLSFCSFLCEDVTEFKINLIRTKSLKILKLEQIIINLVNFQQICIGVQNNNSISIFDLKGNSFSYEQILCLSSVVKSNSNIKNLILSNYKGKLLTYQQIQDFLKDGSIELQYIDLSNFNIMFEQIESFVDCLIDYNCLLALNLENNIIGNEGSNTIKKLLENTDSLQELNISNIGLTGQGFQNICSGLTSNFSLKSLQIGFNRGVTGNQEGNILCICLHEAIQHKKNHQELESLQTQIEFIFLEGNGITEEGNNAILKIYELQKNIFIYNDWQRIDNSLGLLILQSYLNLRQNYRFQQDMIPRYMKNIQITSSNIDDYFCIWLAENFYRFNCIEEINLTNNQQITDDGKKHMFISLFDQRCDTSNLNGIFLANKHDLATSDNEVTYYLKKKISAKKQFKILIKLYTSMLGYLWKRPTSYSMNLTLLSNIQNNSLNYIIYIYSFLIVLCFIINILQITLFLMNIGNIDDQLSLLNSGLVFSFIVQSIDLFYARKFRNQSKLVFGKEFLKASFWKAGFRKDECLLFIYGLITRQKFFLDAFIMIIFYHFKKKTTFYIFSAVYVFGFVLKISTFIRFIFKFFYQQRLMLSTSYLQDLWLFFYTQMLLCTENVISRTVPFKTICSLNIRNILELINIFCCQIPFLLAFLHFSQAKVQLEDRELSIYQQFNVMIFSCITQNVVQILVQIRMVLLFNPAKITQYDFDEAIIIRKFRENESELINGYDWKESKKSLHHVTNQVEKYFKKDTFIYPSKGNRLDQKHYTKKNSEDQSYIYSDTKLQFQQQEMQKFNFLGDNLQNQISKNNSNINDELMQDIVDESMRSFNTENIIQEVKKSNYNVQAKLLESIKQRNKQNF